MPQVDQNEMSENTEKAVEPELEQIALLETEATNETISTQRKKRGMSVGEPDSPEMQSQLREIRKKNKVTADKATLAENAKIAKKILLGELCVFYGKEGSIQNMIQCNECEQFYHLECCNVTAEKYECAIDIVNLLGWICKACRSDNRRCLNTLKDELVAVKLQIGSLL